MNNFSKICNKIIAECNDGKSIAFTDNMVRRNIISDYKNYSFSLDRLCLSSMRDHILNESIFRNPDLLLSDIMNRLENEEYEFSYSKDDVLKLLSGFNYKEKFENEVPDKFRLSVICAEKDEFFRRYGVKLTENAIAEEILDPNDEWHEIIAIPIRKYRHRYGVLKEYLKEELRHVWTYIFGMVDDEFYIGRTAFKADKEIEYKKLNSYQRQVLDVMYFGDIDALKKDYDYIFKIQEGNKENWELSVHIDAIIDMLIDYYDGEISTEKYLKNTLNDVKTNMFNLNNKMLHDFYKNNDSKFKPMKDNIRRLFLLYAFGNENQIAYFEDECKKEFGNF